MRNPFSIGVETKSRVFGLDLLRALAVTMVVLYHGHPLILQAFPSFPDLWVFDGVDLFFVLSGFLIGSILIKTFDQKTPTEDDVKQFWRRRWFRTLPNYYLVFAICLVLTIVVSKSMAEFKIAGPNFDFLVFLQNFATPHPPFYGVAWSLSVEEWFYLLFPVTVYALLRRFPNRQKLCFLAAIAIFITLPLCFRIYKALSISTGLDSIGVRETVFRKTVITRLDTIAFGILGAWVNHYCPKIWKAAPAVCFCLGIAILCAAQYFIKSPTMLCTLHYTCIAVGILLLLPKLTTLKQAPAWLAVPITYISTISYSIYLLHYSVVLTLLRRYAPAHTQSAIVVSYLVYFGATLLLSTLLYRFFEHPMTQLRDRKSATRVSLPAAATTFGPTA